jgi:hypothetical protein
MMVNYNCKTFIVQANGRMLTTCQWQFDEEMISSRWRPVGQKQRNDCFVYLPITRIERLIVHQK